MDLDELIGAYWQQYQLASSSDRTERVRADDYFWAWAFVNDVACGEIQDVDLEVEPIELMIALADQAPDHQALSYLGAGPVENYLRRDAPMST